MNINKYLSRWNEKGIITDKQTVELLADVKEVKKSEAQSSFIIALSTIGAILAGVGAVLFISSNWEYMADSFKVLMLLGLTVGVFFIGYYLKYEHKFYTRFGGALIFLSTLLIGATVFLSAQIYNVNAGSSSLLLVWFILIAPVVYFEKSFPLAVLFCGLSYFWLGYYLNDNSIITDKFAILFLLIFSLIWYQIGTLHLAMAAAYSKLSRTYRLISLMSSMLWIFIMSFKDFFDTSYYAYSYTDAMEKLLFTRSLYIYMCLMFFALMAFNYVLKLIDKNEERLFVGLATISVLAPLYYFYTLNMSILFALLFNLIILSTSIGLIYYGYHREDSKLVNIGSFWLGLTILARYYDLFYDLLPTSTFFMLGGAILLTGGFLLERSRREILSKFKEN